MVASAVGEVNVPLNKLQVEEKPLFPFAQFDRQQTLIKPFKG